MIPYDALWRPVVGEVGERPKVIVWEVDSCEPVATLVGFHRGAVVQVVSWCVIVCHSVP